MKKRVPLWRLLPGIGAIVIGVLFNPWTARLTSSDGQLETGTSLMILGFDVFMIFVGLLCLFATRALITGLLVSLVAGVISIVVIDLLARPLLRSQLYYRPEDIYKHRLPELPALSIFDLNVNYSGRTWGDLSAMTTQDSLRDMRDVDFRTDSYGFRNDASDIDTTRPLDLIILGDSFGAGAGTTQEDVWGVVFHRRYGLNTYNLSMPGFGPWNQLLSLKRELSRLRVGPNTVVLWAIFGGNDIDEPCFANLNPAPAGFWQRLAVRTRTFYRRSPIKIITDRALMGLNSQIPRDTAIVSTLPDGRSFLFYSQYLRHELRTLDDLHRHPNLPSLRLVFAEMARVASDAGLTVVVAHLPTAYAIYGWALDQIEPWTNERLRSPASLIFEELSRENGFDFIDLQPQLLEEAQTLYTQSRELLWWRDDTHWNNHGHAAAAKIVGEWLQSPRDLVRPVSYNSGGSD
ncbi:MAG: hypothetical protein AB1772_01520 [Candidatus Zixiibacteriota bacterium]